MGGVSGVSLNGEQGHATLKKLYKMGNNIFAVVSTSCSCVATP